MKIDVHCHLTAAEFSGDLDAVMQRAADMVVVSSGVDLQDNQKVLDLTKRFSNMKASFGVYPVDAVSLSEKKLQESFDFIRKHRKEMLYLGEAGLDYKELEDKKKQQDIFQQVIQLAEKLKKPLLIHSRKAEEDCIRMVETSSLRKVIFHCFTGEMKLVRKIADDGWGFSIPASIVRSKHFQQLVQEVNIAQLLTETDAPYLSPFSFVKEKALGEKENISYGRNEPAFVVEGVRKIAELKSLDVGEAENILEQNFQKMFL